MAALLFGAVQLLFSTYDMLTNWRYTYRPPIEPHVRPLPSKLKNGWRPNRLHDQQCMLFTVLSQDVRLIIWTIVLGREDAEDVTHMDLGSGSVRSRRCLKEGQHNELGFQHICWEVAWTRHDRKKNWPDLIYLPDCRLLVPLLLSCKQVYNESIHILYAANTFDIRRAECLIRLPKVIPVQHFHSIRSVQFSTAFKFPVNTSAHTNGKIIRSYAWFPPDDASKWPQACRVLSSMSLERLSITIALWRFLPTRAHLDYDVERSIFNVLQPLTDVQASSFKVTLTEDVPVDVLHRLGAVPFTITRGYTSNAGFNAGIHQSFSTSS